MSEESKSMVSASRLIEKKRLQGELQFMKELFDKLPAGDNTDEIESYFNYLQSIIDNIDITSNGPTISDIRRDEFEEDVDGRDYKYFTSSHFQQRASNRNKICDGQSFSDAPSSEVGGCISSQTNNQITSDSSCVSESTRYDIPDMDTGSRP
jgi:hypothetical protein